MDQLTQLALEELRQGITAKTVAQRYGETTYSEAAKHCESEAPSIKQFMAKQDAEKRDFFRCRTNLGLKTQRATLQDHNAMITYILQAVNDGEKPEVLAWLKTYGASNGRPLEWATCVARHTHNKKMNATLQAYQTHPVIEDLRCGNLFTQTHKGMLLRATYSGFSEVLYRGSQIVRCHRVTQRRIKELETRLALAEIGIARASALLDVSERWKGEAEAMQGKGMPCRQIAEQLGKAKSTVHDYLKSLKKEPT